MIAIIDYGVGNLFSLTASLKFLGASAVVTNQPEEIRAADKIILPGVGAFGDAIGKLRDSGLADVMIRETQGGKPLLGICLGMQLLFERSHEYGVHEGLGLIPGEIVSIEEDLRDRFPGNTLKVPHIGWNRLHAAPESPLFQYTNEDDCVYYVHSFYAKHCEEHTIAWSEYGIRITGAVARGTVYGTQFHPEKSGATGLNILRAFIGL